MKRTLSIAQTFASRPVRSVAPYPPGSGPDAVMRILGGQRLATFGVEPSIGAPAELTKSIERDSRTFGDVVQRARISID